MTEKRNICSKQIQKVVLSKRSDAKILLTDTGEVRGGKLAVGSRGGRCRTQASLWSKAGKHAGDELAAHQCCFLCLCK